MSNPKRKAGELRERAMRAGAWALGGNAAAQLIRLISNLIMTRLLVPDMFGVMAVAFVFVTAVAMFSDVGLKQVVVRSPRGSERVFLDTVFAVQVLRGMALAVICLLFALGIATAARAGMFPIGSTYGHPSLPWVLAALSAAPAITGFESTKLLSANRRLAMGRITLLEMSGQLIGFVPMAVWAAVAPSVYALVCGALVAALTRVILSHVWLDGDRDRWRLDAECLREIRDFGSWIMLTSALGFFVRLGDRVVLAWLLAAPVMGLYAIAAIMAGVPNHAMQKLITSVVFPAMGEIQRTAPDRLKAIYYRLRLPVDAVCLTLGAAIFMVGSTFVDLLYDARYRGAGPMLEVLAVALFEARFEVAVQFYLVLGKPRIMAMLMALRLVSMVILIPLGFHIGGAMGAIWGVALSGMPGMLVTVCWVKPRLGILDARKELVALLFVPLGLGLGWIAQSLYLALMATRTPIGY